MSPKPVTFTEGEEVVAGGISRRQFLWQGAASALAVALWPLASACDSTEVEPIVQGAEVPFLTPNDTFFVRNGAEIAIPNWAQPEITREQWAMNIEGLVPQTLTIRFADLQAEADAGNAVTILKTMRCVLDSNEVQGLIGTAVWTGIPLRIFLERAGVDRTATRRLRLLGADGFTNNITAARVWETPDLTEPLLVYEMNGEPLPQKNGGPVRLLLEEAFGYKNVKWLVRVEATTSDFAYGTYQDAGFVDDGVMRVTSRMTRPIGRARVRAGLVHAAGFAVSGFAPVTAVELSVDDGPFTPVEVIPFEEIAAAEPLVTEARQVQEGRPFPFRAVWVKWRTDVQLAPGAHTLRLRATDAAGNVQPEADGDISDGINAVARIEVEAV
ncbi:MAG TPA: molybdopterin-dependent oxidoreductase [Rubricoccaceae bacterium]|nr:molybdopterin-dependent oxidoreductase [Rubricoccaceae bacterium]